MKLWIAGKVKEFNSNSKKISWEFQGVFDSEDKAIEAVGFSDDWFIGPAILNETLPEKLIEWPGAYYPKLKV